MNLIKLSAREYRVESDNSPINVRQIGNAIREGKRLRVIDYEHGIDQTKETLVIVALQGNLTWSNKGDFSLIDILAEIIDEDVLYEVIEEGGADNYILRKRRSLK